MHRHHTGQSIGQALLTADSDDEKYLNDHMQHFLDTVSYQNATTWSTEQKHRLFKMLTDHHGVISKLLGEGYTNSLFCLPEAAKDGIDNDLTREYKDWLEKQ